MTDAPAIVDAVRRAALTHRHTGVLGAAPAAVNGPMPYTSVTVVFDASSAVT